MQAHVGHGRDSSAVARGSELVSGAWCPRSSWLPESRRAWAAPKALLPLGAGDTFLSRIVRTFRAADVDDLVVVVGCDADAIGAALDALSPPVRAVVNPDYERGQLSSLVAGLRYVDRPGVVAALVTLVDVPLVEASTVRAVLDRYRATAAPVVRPVGGGRHGHPIVIDRSLFPALESADPDAGAKAIIRAHASKAGDVEVSDEGAFVDIDTPDDYARLQV